MRFKALLLADVLIVLSVALFASGFFPYKPFFPGLAQEETVQNGVVPGVPFDKLVFMVVDALRR